MYITISLLSSIAILLILWILKLKKTISSRENTKKELQDCENRFKMLFDIAPIFIDSFDKSGSCILWNKECEKVFGWTKDEINAHENSMELFYPHPKDQEKMIEIFNTKSETIFRELTPIAKNGEFIYSTWANVNLPNGESIYMGFDIREQRTAENKLLETQNRLKELNDTLQVRIDSSIEEIRKKDQLLLEQSRLAQMGEMISMIAHQWRQPLSVIDMTAFNIQNKIDLGKFDFDDVSSRKSFLKFLKEGLKDIDNYTQYLTRTIEDFKNFFKPNKKKELTTLDIPIEKALNILESSLIQEGINLTIDNKTTKSILIYPYEVMQVVLNIIKNSIDNFIERKTLKRQITIKVKESTTAFSIKICDNGGGIDEQILDKIFNPYFSTKNDKNGTGLGLYISKVVIENHSSGELNVNNTKDGVCFEIILYGGE